MINDMKLDRRVRRAAEKLQGQHPYSSLDAKDVAQRIRLRLYKGAENFRVRNGLQPDALLRFESGNLAWDKYASVIVKNECARYAARLARESQAARLFVSRDSSDEQDEEGNELNWRAKIDFPAEMEEVRRDELKMDIEAAIARLSGLSRQIIEAYYRDGLGQRALARRFGMALSSFQHGPWSRAKNDFIQAYDGQNMV